jgi:hypothetical protein
MSGASISMRISKEASGAKNEGQPAASNQAQPSRSVSPEKLFPVIKLYGLLIRIFLIVKIHGAGPSVLMLLTLNHLCGVLKRLIPENFLGIVLRESQNLNYHRKR